MAILGLDLGEGFDALKDSLVYPFNKKKPSVTEAITKNDFKAGFNFLEYENGAPRDKDRVQLLGVNMIHAPFEFGGQQKLVKNYYPGNSEPTVQVLGARENNITVKGRLYDRRYKDPQFYGVAQAYQQQIDSIRIRGNLLRIWMGNWQRFGFLEECKFNLKTLGDIEYELSFSIIGFNPPKDSKVVTFAGQVKQIPFEENKKLIEAANQFNATLSPLGASTIKKSFKDQMTAAISEVSTAIGLVTNFVDTILQEVDDLKSGIERAKGLIKYARNKVSSYQRIVGSIPILGNNTNPAIKGVAAGYSNATIITTSITDSANLTNILAELKRQIENVSKTIPLGRHRVIQGDTLQKIAIKFYKNAENWQLIYDHNKLQSTSLTVGQVLEVPRP